VSKTALMTVHGSEYDHAPPATETGPRAVGKRRSATGVQALRVLRVVSSADPLLGGPSSVFGSAALATKAVGVAVECLTLRSRGRDHAQFPDIRRLRAQDVAVHAVEGLPAAVRFLIRTVGTFDVVHIDGSWHPLNVIAVGVARLSGVQAVLTPHATFTDDDMVVTKSRLRLAIKRLLGAYFRLLLGCVVYASQFECRKSIEQRRSAVIPHPVFDDTAGHAARRVRGGRARPDRVRIGYLGRIHPTKRVAEIVSAAAQVREVDLVVAGAGMPDHERVARAAADGCGNVHWLGFVQDDQRERFFADVDFVILVSHYESFGMAAAEALVRGIPVLVSEQVGIAEDVNDMQCGFVVSGDGQSLVDVMRRCASLDDREYETLQHAALRAAERYSYSAHGLAQLDVYRALRRTGRRAAIASEP